MELKPVGWVRLPLKLMAGSLQTDSGESSLQWIQLEFDKWGQSIEINLLILHKNLVRRRTFYKYTIGDW